MRIETLEVAGIEVAISAMRNPMSSWHLSDSQTCCALNGYTCHEPCGDYNCDDFIIGQKDLELAQRLIRGGAEHCKFLRQIHVWADIDMPRYWWSETDTYHYNTKNSTSTMHRLLNTKVPITKELFVSHRLIDDILDVIIDRLEGMRQAYMGELPNVNDSKMDLLVAAKRLLPEGFLQMRTMDTNYAELRNMYFQRRHHRLKEEWVDVFCSWVESLPYAKELIMYEGK